MMDASQCFLVYEALQQQAGHVGTVIRAKREVFKEPYERNLSSPFSSKCVPPVCTITSDELSGQLALESGAIKVLRVSAELQWADGRFDTYSIKSVVSEHLVEERCSRGLVGRDSCGAR